MKMLKEKKSIQKIAIVLVIAILCNFIFPTYSRADWWLGGGIFDPIADFITGVGDAVMILLQGFFIPGSPLAIDKIDKSEYQKRLVEAKLKQLEQTINDLKAEYGDDKKEPIPTLVEEYSKLLIEKQKADWDTTFDSDILNIIFKMQKKYVLGVGGSYILDKIFGNDKIVAPTILYSPGTIFANKIPAFDINFINPKVTNGNSDSYENNTAYVLKDTVSSWYVGFRNLTIVFLLSVLVYIAIRIILSSTAGETAKYKTMLKDWFIAICLVFFMHYMMAFLLGVTQKLIDVISVNGVINGGTTGFESDELFTDVRMYIEGQDNGGMKLGFIIMYLMLIMYTLIFTWKYLKRVIYLAFLTMMAPLVALTYPIDKIKDGSAQAFSKWFKEYLFNVLIQPIHLILYTVLIVSALDLATTNIIYSIIALAFMLEAEKIIKDFFGIKAERGESTGAISGGAIFGYAAGKIKNAVSHIPEGSSGKSKDNSGGNNNNRIKSYNERPTQKAILNAETFNSIDSSGENIQSNVNTQNTASDENSNDSARNNENFEQTNSGTESAQGSKTFSYNKSRSNNNKQQIQRVQQKSKSKIKHPRLNGIKAVGGRFVSRNAGKIAKIAVKGAGAATLGTIGLAAGLASDNDKDILTYTGMGLGIGSYMGGKSIDLVKGIDNGVNTIRDDYKRGYYGDDYESKVLDEKLEKEYLTNKENIRYFKSKYGDKYMDKMNTSLDLQKYGMKDQKDIDKAIGIMDEYGLPVDQAAFISDFAKNVSRNDLLDSKKNNANRDLVAQMLNVDLSTESGKKAVDKFMAPVNKFVGLPGNYKPKE